MEHRDFFILNNSGAAATMAPGVDAIELYFPIEPEADFDLQQVRASALLLPVPWSPDNLRRTDLPLSVEIADAASCRIFLPSTPLELLHLAPMPAPRLVLARSSLLVRLRKAPFARPLYEIYVALFGQKVFRPGR
jgi:hypothetical protein